MKIRPLDHRILVTRVSGARGGRGGIATPTTPKEKPQEGKVISVGNGKMNEDGK
jgi:chaperonin GroES